MTQSLKGSFSNVDGNRAVSGFCIDSRTLKQGEWFFCISGDRTNGHLYIENALEEGAAGIIAEKQQVPEHLQSLNIPWVWVKNCNTALRDWAEAHRIRFKGKVFAITGSNGKTSTKEILAGLCRHLTPKTHATSGNFNNFIGLPLTLLSAPLESEYWVVEMGSNCPGEIKTLSLIAKPDFALITSIGASHMEFFKNTQEVAVEKSGILAGMSKGSTLVCPANILERKEIQAQATRQQMKTIFCGFKHDLKAPANVCAEVLNESEGSLLLFETKFQTTIRNSLFRSNLLIALTSLHEANVSISQLQKACASLQLEVSGRFQEIHVKNWLLINDSYNANSSSFQEVLLSIKKLYPNRHLIVVAGAMAELGTQSHKLHCQTGAMIAQAGSAYLFVWKSTPESESYLQGWNEAGGETKNAIVADNLESLTQQFNEIVRPNDVVLVKGSRSARMERFVEVVEKF